MIGKCTINHMGAAIVATVLGLCLFGGSASLGSARFAGPLLLEVRAAFRDPTTQWMVLACAIIYFIVFTVLRTRRTGSRFWRIDNPDLWLTAMMALAGLAYVFEFDSASRTTQTLTLLGAVVIGKGVAVWSGWRRDDHGSRTAQLAGIMVILLLLGLLMQGQGVFEFQYRGQQRWSGAWDNPNTFGALMGVGVVLAVGFIARSAERGVRNEGHGTRSAECGVRSEGIGTRSAECGVRSEGIGTQSAECGVWNEGIGRRGVRWLQRAFFGAAALAMAVGLVMSYSRGAWVATAIALGYLAAVYLAAQASTFQVSGFRLQALLLTFLILASLLILAFWSFRHTEQTTVRRAFSVGNVNDFSWRKRVAAWEGTLQMTADQPWFGFGWNQTERVYDKLYRKPKVDEAMAIQMNDYFTLGTTLGIPALVCFLAFIGFNLSPRNQPARQPASASPASSSSFHPPSSILHPTCSTRAGAIVLLIAFWFDGGLFKLATGAVFWILLEKGRPNGTGCDDAACAGSSERSPILVTKKTRWSHCLLLILYLSSFACAAEAPRRFTLDGTVTTQRFDTNGHLMQERTVAFQMSVSEPQWLVRIRSNSADALDYTEVSFDGENSYFLDNFSSYVNHRRTQGDTGVANNIASGITYARRNPANSFCAEAGPLWLAYASARYLSGVQDGLVESPLPNDNVRTRNLLKATWEMDATDSFPATVYYFGDEPPDGIWTNVTYKVTQYTDFNGLAFPKLAILQHYLRLPGRRAAHSLYTRYTILLQNISAYPPHDDFKPAVPGKTVVTETRLQDEAGVFLYTIDTNGWPTVAAIKRAPWFDDVVKRSKGEPPRSPSRGFVRAVLLVAVAAPLLLFLFKLKYNHKDRKL